MSIIVPLEMPKSCSTCLFRSYKFSYIPGDSRVGPELQGKQGIACNLCKDEDNLLVVPFGDTSLRASYCPLREVQDNVCDS